MQHMYPNPNTHYLPAETMFLYKLGDLYPQNRLENDNYVNKLIKLNK